MGAFGTDKALAVIAHLLSSIETDTGWTSQLGALLREFPAPHALSIESSGTPQGWETLDIWRF